MNNLGIDALIDSTPPLARRMLNLASLNHMPELTALCRESDAEDSRRLLLVVSQWILWAIESHGEERIWEVLDGMALDIASAPVSEQETRMAFCDFTFAYKDYYATGGGPGPAAQKVVAAWEKTRGYGWDVVVELLSLMLGFSAFLGGWVEL